MRYSPIRSGRAALSATLFLAWGSVYAAVISTADQSAAPGQTVVASVTFSAEGQRVSGLQFDIEWDVALDVKVAIGDRLRTPSKLLYAAALGPRAARCLLGGMNADMVADGEVLKLFVIVNGSGQAGTAQVRFTNAVAADPAGNPVSLRSPAVVNVQIQGAANSSLRPETLLNSASLFAGQVAPGEIVTFFGYAPGTPAILFNGIPAPVLYAGSNQVNLIVPFGLNVGAPASVELRDNGRTVSKGVLPAARTAPAVFTQSGTGSGPGAVLNQNYSLNSASNPAAPGDIVMIYGTGFGAVNPPTADGQAAAGPAATALAVTASIGGIDAQVIYAGAAPGLVAGVAQINVIVPPSLRTNPAASLSLSIGSVTTPAGVTVSIR
jgi:uncharacterized protein (TIGR03437 family)